MVKKTFFRESTKGEIKRLSYTPILGLQEISSLNPSEYTIISPLVPTGYKSSRKFMKHAPEVQPKRQYTHTQAMSEAKTPVQLRETTFNGLNGHFYSGYSFLPLGRDKRKRRVALTECLEGARIYAYANQINGSGINVKPYHDARRIKTEGAEIVVSVPSRTSKNPTHKFKLMSVPVIDSPEKYQIAPNIGSDHSCASQRFNIRYRFPDDKEASGIVNLCAHEIAAYLAIVDHFWETEKNIVPLQMSQFAYPTKDTTNYYLNLENNVLVEDSNLRGKDKLRKLNRAEKEIALWDFVFARGHDNTFFPKKSRDGNLSDYVWTR